MKKKILITGGAGYIGSHTALYMAQKNYEVIILDAFIYGQDFNHSWATVIRGDCGDKQLLHSIFSQHTIDAVMHFAANIEVGRSVREPLLFYDNNVVKTVSLLESMLEHSIKKFIFSSSCAVYGVPDNVPITEQCSKNPISPYGKTKLMIEHILHDMSVAHDFRYIALRYFNAAGAAPGTGLCERHIPETHLIPLIFDAALHSKPFSIFGHQLDTPDGTCIRDFLHVVDIASAHYAALQHLDAQYPSDSFNLGTGNGLSVKAVINHVQKLTNKPIKIVEQAPRPGDPEILVADPSYTHHVLKWQPQFSDIEYILRTAYGT